MSTRWLVEPENPDQERDLTRALHISPLLARILIHRGADSAPAAQRFLSARLTDLGEPERIPGMGAAADRVARAVQERERVLIFGDYDVDGLCSIALLSRLLRRFGLSPRHYIPHRIQDGYGLNRHALEEIAGTDTDLVVTVDCGMDAWRYRDVIEAAPYDLMVVDHHEPAERVTSAVAVVNPKLQPDRTAFRDFAGVGVVFHLAWALVRRLGLVSGRDQDVEGLFAELLALTALGTVADVVPLLGENRILTRLGLAALEHTELPGLRALLQSAGLAGQVVRAHDIAFRLGPRLNAAGRMGEADLALELLTTDAPGEALEICSRLEAHNKARRALQEEIERQALDQVDKTGAERVLLVSEAGWSPGVIGIVAGRLASRFYRPAIVVSIEGELARGSARSIPGFHVLQALRECADCLLEFGGHAQAAGFTLPADRLKELHHRLIEHAHGLPEELWQPALVLEAEVPLTYLNREAVTELERLEPLGEQNPEPVLASHGVEVGGDIRRLGSRGKHLSFYARQGRSAFRVIGFNLGERAGELAALDGPFAIAYTPTLSTFRSSSPEVELKLCDFRPTPTGN